MIDWQSWIVSNPEIRGGTPCIKGTRIAAREVVCYVEQRGIEEFLDVFPWITREQVEAAILFEQEEGKKE